VTPRSARLAAAVAVLLTVRCSAGPDAGHATKSPEAQRLAGAWTVRLELTRFRFEALGAYTRHREVVGEVVLVANHWLDGGNALAHPTHYGTYDLDFAALGFDPRTRGQLPVATARLSGDDSIEIVFDPENERELVRMHGVMKRDSIVGTWELEPSRAGGDAAGSVIMTKRP